MYKIISAVYITLLVAIAIGDVGTPVSVEPGETFTWIVPITIFGIMGGSWVLGYLSAKE